MPRSVYSNPIEAGIRAFGDVSDILQKQEEAPLRRQLLAQEIADRKLSSERTRKGMDQDEKVRQQWEKETGIKNIDLDTKTMLGHLQGAEIELDAARKEGREPKYSTEQQDAIFKTLGKNPVFNPDAVDVQTDAIRKVRGFMRDNAPQLLQQGGRLDRDKAPDVFDAFDKIFEGQVNRGTDKHGNDTKGAGVTKRVKSVLIDPKDQSLSFVLDVSAPVKEGQVFKHIGDDTSVFTVNPEAKGMVEPGNIDLSRRPVVRNADGSISTVRSMSVSFGKGQEVLIPMVSDSGKILTKEEAIKEYQKTGKHLGKFDSERAATDYAEALHNDSMWAKDIAEYSATGKASTSYDAPMTFDRAGGDPNAPVVKLPIGILDGYLDAHERLGTKIQQLRAQLGPEKYAEKMEGITRTRKENAVIYTAMEKVDTSKPVDEQRKTFVMAFTKLMPEASVKEITELAKTIIADKEELRSEAGKTISDRSRLVGKHGEGSPELKAFDEAVEAKQEKGEKNPTEASLSLRAAKGDKDAKRAIDIMRKTEKEKKGTSEATVDRRNKSADRKMFNFFKVQPGLRRIVEDEDIRDIDALLGHPDLTEETRKSIENKREEVGKLIDGGMSEDEAIRKVQKAMGKTPTLRPISKAEIDRIVKKFSKMKNGPEKQKAMEKEAHDSGFDPDKMETE